MRWIIGDVHGMIRPLETIVNEIDRTDAQAQFSFVGDYVNRGPESRAVIDLLLALENARFIRGNHDDVLDQILHAANYAENPSRGDRFIAFTWFLEHGLFETLTSYGVTRELISRVIGRRDRESIQLLIEMFPEPHRRFIRTLPVFIEDDDLFIIHGKWPVRETRSPAAVLSSTPIPQLRHELLWGRFTEAELQKKKAWPKVGFFGHTPVPTYRGHESDYSPIVAPNMILLDTAAALSPTGRLTAMCAETSQLIQAEPSGKLVSPPSTARSA